MGECVQVAGRVPSEKARREARARGGGHGRPHRLLVQHVQIEVGQGFLRLPKGGGRGRDEIWKGRVELGRVAEELQPSDSSSFLQILIRPPPSTRTRAKESSSRWEEPTPTPGRTRFRHVILSPWAASLGGANPVREAPGSVAAVGARETKQATAAPSCLSSLLLLPAHKARAHTTANSRTFPDPKVKVGRSAPKAEGRGKV